MCTGRLVLLLGPMRQTNVSRVSDTVSRPDQSAPQLGKYMAKDYLGCHITQNGPARLWLLTAFDGPNIMWIQLTFSIAAASGGRKRSFLSLYHWKICTAEVGRSIVLLEAGFSTLQLTAPLSSYAN